MTVIGVGAIGRQVALQLASIGARRLQLIDFDVVEETNVVTQGYFTDDIGLPKVEATKISVECISPSIKCDTVQDRYRSSIKIGEVVFCCVDSIGARSAIWRSAGPRCQFWCDGRMLGETIRILSVSHNVGRDYYPTTLFRQAEAQAGGWCWGGSENRHGCSGDIHLA